MKTLFGLLEPICRLARVAPVGCLLILLGGAGDGRAETWSATNQPGTWTDFSFAVDSGVTNLSLTVSNTPTVYSHLLLQAGAAPSLEAPEYAARAAGRDNAIHLELPELVATNHVVRVYTPAPSAAHAFTLTLERDQAGLRDSGKPVTKPASSLTAGSLAPGGWHYFRVELGGSLPGWIVHLNGSNPVDLYVRRGALPTTAAADRLSVGQALDTVYFSDAEATPGTYFIGVHVSDTTPTSSDYILQTAPGALTGLAWDPGVAADGTAGVTNDSGTAGDCYFKITTEQAAVGVWRTALEVTAGEASVYLQRGLLPAPPMCPFASANAGSDGFVLHASQFEAGEEWFLLVRATAGAQWRLWSGEVFVQDLGPLAADAASGSGAVPIGPEGMRFFKTTVPVNTLAWRLGLNGAENLLLVKKNSAPHPLDLHSWRGFDLQQSGQMLVVPDYLVPGNDVYFVGVVGTPGTVMTLDSRQQPVADLAFRATTNVTTSGFGYRTFRIQVPVEQVGWQVTVTPISGDANLAIRRNLVPNEWRNEALSEAAGSVADSVALGPPVLSDGVFYLTVYGAGSYTCALSSGDAQVTDMDYVDVRVNAEPHRVGWKFYRVANLQQQSGTLGWELLLAGHPPGTEIALRRNAIPYRRNYRTDENGYLSVQGDVDISSLDGFLQHPAHPADIWYVGIYNPTNELGAFTLTARELGAESLAVNGGVATRSAVPSDQWQFFRVEIPLGVAGWDLRLVQVTSGQPQLVVRRGQFPVSLETRSATGGPWWSPSASRDWPVGFQWAAVRDYAGYPDSPDGESEAGRVMAVGVGNPLEPGTYYVGVKSATDPTPMSFTLQSRAVGVGQALPLTDLSYTGGSHANEALPARDAAYYRVAVPTNTSSWQVRLQVTSGEALLLAQKDALPNVEPCWNSVLSFSGGFKLQQDGNEHFVLLPENDQTNLAAGTYYLAVVSEGENPQRELGRIGQGHCSYRLTSVGRIAVADLGNLGSTDLVLTNAQEGGEIKAYQFNVPDGIAAVELRLEERSGNPLLAVVPGAVMPCVAQIYYSMFDNYGSLGGRQAARKEGAALITLANPAGVYSLLVKANTSGSQIPAAAYTLRLHPLATAALTFDGGASTVTDQAAGTWRYFRVDVPAHALGWDLRLVDVTQGSPQIVVRRGQLPDQVFTSSEREWPEWYYGPRPQTNWPAGYQVAAELDWTRRAYPVEGWTEVRGQVLTLSMGNPLEPGTYYVGIANLRDGAPATYTLVSRGIGGSLSLPVVELPFYGGSTTCLALPARDIALYRVSVPPNASSWQIRLATLTGDAMLAVQHGALPHLDAQGTGSLGLAPCTGGRRVQKDGNEHFLLLPESGQSTVPPGDYFIAVVSEGVAPDYNRIGAGSSDFQFTSRGPIVLEDLGTVSSAGLARPATLEAGEAQAYRFTVPAGASSVEVRLQDRIGSPHLAARPGDGLPNRAEYDPQTLLDVYGVRGGQLEGRQEDAELVTLANPTPGLYSLLVKSKALDWLENHFVDSGYTLVVRGSGTVPLDFDGGSVTVADQSPGSWSFYRVEVPAHALGWDVRLTEVAGGRPRLVVRRDVLPESPEVTGWDSYRTPFSYTNWPSGAQLAYERDWTTRAQPAEGTTDARWLTLAIGMGNPLEPGVYFVGVYNDDPSNPTRFRLWSRGVGLSLPVTDLAFAGGSVTHSGLVPREAAYYRVTVPEGATSWQVKLTPTAGEALLAIQQHAVPSVAVSADNSALYPPRNGWAAGGRKMQKAGNEHFVLLPEEGSHSIPAGMYYLAVASEGVNPADEWHIGLGSSQYGLESVGEAPLRSLGSTSAGVLAHTATLEGGELARYSFTVASGTLALEARLADRQGNPVLALRLGDQTGYYYEYYGFRTLGYYGVDGGYSSGLVADAVVITLPNPAPGNYRLVVKAKSTDDERTFPNAAYQLQVRSVPVPELSFGSPLAPDEPTNAAVALLADGQRAFYRVVVPETSAGQPVIGWKLELFPTQGRAAVRVCKDRLPSDNQFSTTRFVESAAVVVPPYLEPGTWFVEVKAEGTTEFTLVSRPLRLERPAWLMPVPGQAVSTPGVAAPEFGDSGVDLSGQPLPDDRGVYLEDGKYHFYAITVPPTNLGLIHVALESISGNPDLYARVGAPPTLTHEQGGSSGQSLLDRAMTGASTEFGTWVPGYGRHEDRLTPGIWYVAVRANGNSNARYRLRFSLGEVQELTLNGGSASNQPLASGDWRYYRTVIPALQTANWTVTFSQQSGEVELFLRDTVAPGDRTYSDWYIPARDWQYDSKNQGPYPQSLPPGTHAFACPPVRPGHVYYLGFRARSDAVFSVASSTSGALLNVSPANFYGGIIHTTLPPQAAALYRIDVPSEAARWRHTSTHDAALLVCLEQGTVPRLEQGHWRSYGADNGLNQYLRSPNSWPWVAGQAYFLLATNTSSEPQPLDLVLDGRNLSTDDDDADGLPDAWETEYFGYGWLQTGTGDPDGDGLSNAQECQLHTNPTNGHTRGTFSALQRLPAGRLQMMFRGEPDRRYQIESSTNLVTWTLVQAVISTNGTIPVEDPTTNGPRRFYRATLLP